MTLVKWRRNVNKLQLTGVKEKPKKKNNLIGTDFSQMAKENKILI